MSSDAGGAGGGSAGAALLPAGGAPAVGAAVAPGATVAAEPWFKGWVKDDGSLNAESYARLPENLKGLASGDLKNAKSIDDVLTKLGSLSTLAGRKALAPLPAGASPEDIAAHSLVMRAVNGVPEKPEGYGFRRPDDLPEQAWNDGHAQAAAKIMHEGNVPPAVAAKLMQLQAATVKENIQDQEKYAVDFFKGQDDTFRAALQKDGLDYDKTLGLVNRVALQYGMKPDNVLLKNAEVRMMLHQVGQAMGEAKFIGGANELNTRSDRSMAESIMHDKTNADYVAYWDGQHAKNGEVKRRVAGLLEAATTAERAAADKR